MWSQPGPPEELLCATVTVAGPDDPTDVVLGPELIDVLAGPVPAVVVLGPVLTVVLGPTVVPGPGPVVADVLDPEPVVPPPPLP